MDPTRRQRPRAGEPLEAVGRAERHACMLEGGAPTELWALPPSDAALARRLASLGAEGLGGFDAGWGEDEVGAFLLRRVPSRTVDSLAKGERLEGLMALAKVRDVARALAAAERSAIFPGPLRPAEVALGSKGRLEAFVLAESFVRARLGVALGSSPVTAPSPRWTPPEQARGAPWDNAANRYVLGLVAYRLVAGAHPLSGFGVRDAMRAQDAAPPPFDDAIARGLRPGLQSLVLAMLDPEPGKRPRSATEIVRRCEEILQGDVDPVRRSDRAESSPDHEGKSARDADSARDEGASRDAQSAHAATVRRSRAAAPARRASAIPQGAREIRPRRSASAIAMAAAPVLIGLAVAGAGFAASRSESAPAARSQKALSREPLVKTSAQTCAPCHTRQVAEWERSVMAHSVKSPLFGALESLVEEEVGKDARCPNGAGILRGASGDVCRDERTGLAVTGSGGEHWCVNCHSAGDNLRSTVPPWSASSFEARGRRPLRDLLSAQAMEGVSCAVCHTTIGPAHGSGYQGNPTWTSFLTGQVFPTRPEDGAGTPGISNSGYLMDPRSLLTGKLGSGGPGDPIVHRAATPETKRYLASSEHCGACHDVRLFGTDTLGVRDRGEHFKRLRNAYSEWRAWADGERAAGRRAASCQDCHMSLYPGVCVKGDAAGAAREGCPPGMHFEARAPGERARGPVATSSSDERAIVTHYFTSVDVPLAPELPEAWATDATVDRNGLPLGLEIRREQLLRHTFRFRIAEARRRGGRLEIPLEVQNVGAGHRVPAGFSQEREIWVELTVKDARGDVVYEVGKVSRDDDDLRDKVFTRVNTRGDSVDAKGRPLGMFGADVVDGPDVPEWDPPTITGATTFRGRGLVNLQNGFLRCVRCIGFVDASGKCQPGPGQGRTRADRFDDGAYDLDTGECRSNLVGGNALFETYFPVGALDADRGVLKAPDAILDTRSAPPGAQLRYTYDLDAAGRSGPFRVEARLRFRPFPPFLLRAFADYEARKAAAGLRPSGAQLTPAMIRRNKIVDLAAVSVTVP